MSSSLWTDLIASLFSFKPKYLPCSSAVNSSAWAHVVPPLLSTGQTGLAVVYRVFVSEWIPESQTESWCLSLILRVMPFRQICLSRSDHFVYYTKSRVKHGIKCDKFIFPTKRQVTGFVWLLLCCISSLWPFAKVAVALFCWEKRAVLRDSKQHRLCPIFLLESLLGMMKLQS